MGSWSSFSQVQWVAGEVLLCLLLLSEVMGLPLDQVRKTGLRLMAVTSGSGGQDVVIHVTLRVLFWGYSRLSNTHRGKNYIQGWFHSSSCLLSRLPRVYGDTSGASFSELLCFG